MVESYVRQFRVSQITLVTGHWVQQVVYTDGHSRYST